MIYPHLNTPEKVHAAMLAGDIAPITMRQCADVHGPGYVQAFIRWDELRGDIKLTSDVLIDFPGEHVWQQAQNAVEHIEWLKAELQISRYQERAALDCLAQNNRHLHGGSCNGEGEARQASGAAGQVEERAEGSGAEGT